MTMTEHKTIERLPVNDTFSAAADAAAIERTTDALRSHGFEVQVVADAAAARDFVMSQVPDGAEVGQGASRTMDELGLTEIIEKSGRYDAVRPRTRAMDRATQMREIRKLGAAPDVQLNSVQAVTEDGRILVASSTGSQLGPIGFGAGHVVLVVGAQKIVPDLATAFRRLEEYSYPIEDANMQATYGIRSSIRKTLVLNAEGIPGRVTVVIVRQPLGI